jgi:aryl-alcohol dehydrogenase-like predicted oxidoreductase
METTIFGNTGRTVSRIGFGGAVAGLKNYIVGYDPADADDARGIHQALARALEKGINFFDTASAYGDGASERLFGDVLGDADPKQYFIATKCSVTDYDGVMRSFERSLKNLRRDTIDLLQIHGTSYTDEEAAAILKPGGMLDAMRKLKQDGVLGAVGFTSEDNNRVVYDFIDTGLFDQMQVCYNFIFQHPYEASRPFGSTIEAKKKGMAVSSMRSTTSGIFQKWMRSIRPDDTFDYTPALIQFALSCPGIDVVLIGMRNAREVDLNVALCEDLKGRVDLNDLNERYVTAHDVK